VLPAPVMLLATNRESTGIGSPARRPHRDHCRLHAGRGDDGGRIALTGIIREATWPSFDSQPAASRPSMYRDSARCPTRRVKRWLARFDCYPQNPLTSDPNDPEAVAGRFSYFRLPIARVADPFTLRLIGAVGAGARRRTDPTSGRRSTKTWSLCTWSLHSGRSSERLRFEQIVMHALSGTAADDGHRLHADGDAGLVVTFRRDVDGNAVWCRSTI
jgi:hypothetical protein